MKYAYEYTRRRNSKKKMLTLVHKCNVLTHCGDLWVRVHKEMGDAHYPDIKQDYTHVDACTMWFVKQPEYYDVIVTENLFGDIITDLAAIIQGGRGIAAGGNINPEGVSMFEPMGGSAPKYTGMNIINPLATICAGGMMMDTLGEPAIAKAVDKAVHDALASGKIKSLSAGKMGMGTREVGDLIAKLVSQARSSNFLESRADSSTMWRRRHAHRPRSRGRSIRAGAEPPRLRMSDRA